MKILLLLILSFIIVSCTTKDKNVDSCVTIDDCRDGLYCINSICRNLADIKGDLNNECKDDGSCNSDLLECIDNICNLPIENKECKAEEKLNCYTGDINNLRKGICRIGYYTCNSDSKWGTICIDEVLPQDEICDDGLDNNCNGVVDENCNNDYCTSFDKKDCYSGDSLTLNKGICKKGYNVCTDNHWNSVCIGEVLPQDEICDDGIDNNCNGKVDENCSCIVGAKQPCYSALDKTKGVGVCKSGIQTCLPEGIWSSCLNEVTPTEELCDALDNDCNGIIDDGVTKLCENSCQDEPQELCDGIDNNCNGKIDEFCSKKCLDFEICGDFIDNNCDSIVDNPDLCKFSRECIPTGDEFCGDGIDNDCKGGIDDGCGCEYGSEQNCYEDNNPNLIFNKDNPTSLCKRGSQLCIGGEFWSDCAGQVLPQSERCNGYDDDCDGEIDENFHVGESCSVGYGLCKKDGILACDLTGGVICIDQDNNPIVADNSKMSLELCDNLDNDCDGFIDEDFNLNESCNSGYGACQTVGVTECSVDGYSVVCNAQEDLSKSVDEICGDFIDNDCDGIVDEIGDLEYCDNNKDDNCNGIIDEEPCIGGGPVVTCPTISDISSDGKIFTLKNYNFRASATDPNGDILTYEWEVISAPEGNGQYPSPNDSLETVFKPYLVSNRMGEVPQPYILKFTATERDTPHHLSSSCEVSFNVITEDVLHIELIWDSISDMDLHLVTPNGDQNSFSPRDGDGYDCNYATCRGPSGMSWSGSSNSLENPYLDLDNTIGFGCPDGSECNRPENINVPSPRVNSTDLYRVGVYAFEGVGNRLKLKVLCKAQREGEFVVREYEKSLLKSTSNNSNRWWKPSNIIWHGTYCSIEDN